MVFWVFLGGESFASKSSHKLCLSLVFSEAGTVGSVRQSSFSKTAYGLFRRARYQSLS